MNFVDWNGLLKRVPVFALLALAAWLGARTAWSAWELARLEPPFVVSAAPAAADAGPADAQAPGSSLFGVPRGISEAAPAGPPGLLDSGRYQLRGVVAATREGMAHAIIETGGVARAYFPGESLAAGLVVHEVRPNEVRLRRGEGILLLPLAGMSATAKRRPAEGGFAPLGVAEPQEFLSAPPRTSLSQLMSMEPVMDSNGSMQGYRVFPSGSQSAFEALGLVSGDLIVAVNGVPFDGGNLPQAMQQMSAGGDMMLSVNREGEPLEVRVGSENFDLVAM